MPEQRMNPARPSDHSKKQPSDQGRLHEVCIRRGWLGRWWVCREGGDQPQGDSQADRPGLPAAGRGQSTEHRAGHARVLLERA